MLLRRTCMSELSHNRLKATQKKKTKEETIYFNNRILCIETWRSLIRSVLALIHRNNSLVHDPCKSSFSMDSVFVLCAVMQAKPLNNITIRAREKNLTWWFSSLISFFLLRALLWYTTRYLSMKYRHRKSFFFVVCADKEVNRKRERERCKNNKHKNRNVDVNGCNKKATANIKVNKMLNACADKFPKSICLCTSNKQKSVPDALYLCV